MGACGLASMMPVMLPVLETVEDGRVLGARHALGDGDDGIEIEIVRAARRVVELDDLQRERRTELDERLDHANRVRDTGDRALLVSSSRPVLTAPNFQPCGPEKSTTFRPARCSLRTRRASSSTWSQASR